MSFATPDNLPDFVTRELMEKIIRNELKPGERILESKLAEEMGISRSPIREALRILEKNRLVELIPRKGARVTDINAEHIEWFYDIFEALYGMVVIRAIERCDNEDLQVLAGVLENISNAALSGDVIAYYSSIFEFAAVGMKAVKNPLLEQMVLELGPGLRRIQYASLMYRKDDLKENSQFFIRLMQCANDKDLEAASVIIKEYAQNEKVFALSIASKNESKAG